MEEVYNITDIRMYAIIDGEYVEVAEVQDVTVELNEPFLFNV